MGRLAHLVFASALVFILAAGCPMAPSDMAAGPGTISTLGSSTNEQESASPAPASSTPAPEPTRPDGAQADALTDRFQGCYEPTEKIGWCDEVLLLVNNERAAQGAAALVRNTTLDAQAEQYACEMIHYEFFAHQNPVTESSLRDRAEEFGYEYRVIGENLAAGQQSPGEVVAAWMDSEGHRENILDARFTEIGVAVRTGGSYGVYWVLEFGLPR